MDWNTRVVSGIDPPTSKAPQYVAYEQTTAVSYTSIAVDEKVPGKDGIPICQALMGPYSDNGGVGDCTGCT